MANESDSLDSLIEAAPLGGPVATLVRLTILCRPGDEEVVIRYLSAQIEKVRELSPRARCLVTGLGLGYPDYQIARLHFDLVTAEFLQTGQEPFRTPGEREEWERRMAEYSPHMNEDNL